MLFGVFAGIFTLLIEEFGKMLLIAVDVLVSRCHFLSRKYEFYKLISLNINS